MSIQNDQELGVTREKLRMSPLLKALQEDDSSSIRAAAAGALGYVGLRDKKVVKNEAVMAGLLKALKEDKSDDVRASVLFAFRYLKPTNVFPVLETALKDKNANVRLQAVETMGATGEPKTSIPLLIEVLSDKEYPMYKPPAQPLFQSSVGGCAAEALSKFCPDAIPALCKAMEDKNPIVRENAVFALGIVKKEVRPLILKEVPAILPLLNDKERHVQCTTAQTLGRIKAADAVPALLAKLDDKDVHVRGACIDALGQIGPEATGAIPRLKEILKSGDKDEVQRTEKALKTIGAEKN